MFLRLFLKDPPNLWTSKSCVRQFWAGCTNYQPEISILDPIREEKRFIFFLRFMRFYHWSSLIIDHHWSSLIIDHHWSLIIIDHHWSSLIIIDHHWSSLIIDHHWSLIITEHWSSLNIDHHWSLIIIQKSKGECCSIPRRGVFFPEKHVLSWKVVPLSAKIDFSMKNDT